MLIYGFVKYYLTLKVPKSMVVIGGGDGDRFESDSGSQRLLMATI